MNKARVRELQSLYFEKSTRIDVLTVGDELFHAFCCWLYNVESFNGNELLAVIEKPWKWTTEYNTQFLPYFVCEMNPVLKTYDAYVAGFMRVAGIDDIRQATSLCEPSKGGTFYDGMVAGSELHGQLELLIVSQGSALEEALSRDLVEVSPATLRYADDGQAVVCPRPARDSRKTVYAPPVLKYKRSFREYAKEFPQNVVFVDRDRISIHYGVSYFSEGRDGQPEIVTCGWDSSD